MLLSLLDWGLLSHYITSFVLIESAMHNMKKLEEKGEADLDSFSAIYLRTVLLKNR